MPRDIGPIEDLGWNQTGSMKRESAEILARTAQIMLDRESVDQGSITPSPPEISADLRRKPRSWEGRLMPCLDFRGYRKTSGKVPSSGLRAMAGIL
jgi:hypothetical protein